MKLRLSVAAVLLSVFAAATVHAAKRVDAPAFQAMTQPEAGRALLQKALAEAGKGSWERIAVGRVYYLGGMKAEGQAIFDSILSQEPDPSDPFRVARVYREAGEWPRAKELFDKSLLLNPKDENGLAEVGAYYLANGDRATAEVLFDRSFKLHSEIWATVSAAGAYLGVAPQE